MRTHLKCPHFHLCFGHCVEVLLVHSHIGCFSSKGALEKGERTHRGMRVKRVRGRKREGEEGVEGKRKKNGERRRVEVKERQVEVKERQVEVKERITRRQGSENGKRKRLEEHPNRFKFGVYVRGGGGGGGIRASGQVEE